MELGQISSRNLGQDDRGISDHGKEARFPFLDENVVSFLNSLPVWEKANLTSPCGIGEKLILPLAAVELGQQQPLFFCQSGPCNLDPELQNWKRIMKRHMINVEGSKSSP